MALRVKEPGRPVDEWDEDEVRTSGEMVDDWDEDEVRTVGGC